jgi:hypothetical protein
MKKIIHPHNDTHKIVCFPRFNIHQNVELVFIWQQNEHQNLEDPYNILFIAFLRIIIAI